MQNNFPKISLFLSVTFLVLSCLVFLFFYRAIDNNNRESQLREGNWQSEEQKRNDVKMLDHSVQTIQGDKTQLDTHFAPSSDIVPFLNTVEGLASKVNAKTEIDSVAISADHTGLMVSMKASGDFGNLYKFLTLLENSPYEIEFVSMDISKEAVIDTGNKNVKIPRWDVSLNLKLLSFVE